MGEIVVIFLAAYGGAAGLMFGVLTTGAKSTRFPLPAALFYGAIWPITFGIVVSTRGER